MLFLLRPRQAFMPFAARGRTRTEQEQYNQMLNQAYGSTRRVEPAALPGTATANATITDLQKLAELQQSGALTDEELEAAKARVLSREASTT